MGLQTGRFSGFCREKEKVLDRFHPLWAPVVGPPAKTGLSDGNVMKLFLPEKGIKKVGNTKKEFQKRDLNHPEGFFIKGDGGEKSRKRTTAPGKWGGPQTQKEIRPHMARRRSKDDGGRFVGEQKRNGNTRQPTGAKVMGKNPRAGGGKKTNQKKNPPPPMLGFVQTKNGLRRIWDGPF